MSKSLILGMLTLFAGGTGIVQATVINNSTGLIGVGITPTYTLTFNNTAGLSANSAITNQFTFAGVTFSTPAYYDGNNGGFGSCNFSNESGDCVTNYTTSGGAITSVPGTPFSIFFALPQTYAAFALVTDASGNNNTIITALRNGVIVDQGTFTTSTTGPNNYYGFYGESTPFDSIRIGTTGANLVIIDNLSLQSVPEPGTIGLLAFGIGGLAVMLRRRRSA